MTGTELSTQAYTNFYIENESGQRTGRVPDGTTKAEIPGTYGAYGTESVDDHEDTAEGAQADETVRFELSPFPAGQYTLKILPSATTDYYLRFTIRNDNGSYLTLDEDGFATAGTPISYAFEFHPEADTPSGITKDVTFSTLRQSIQAARQLGQLGDAAFVSCLEKMLVKAEALAEKTQNKQAADRLGQFIHRLESAFKREPDINAGDEPDDIENAESMRRFAASKAKDSLEADARTLIASLGETPKK